MSPRQAPVRKATLADGSTIDYLDDMIGAGGEKEVYFTADKQSVVAFYKDGKGTSDRLARLEEIVGTYNPTASGQRHSDYWRTLYCWPTAIVVKPRLGVVVPKYPANYFFPHNDSLLCSGAEKEGMWFLGEKTRPNIAKHAPEELGNLLTTLAMLTR